MIKYRVWDKINKSWLDKNKTEFAILSNGKLIVSTSQWYEGLGNVNQDNYIIQEYTGRTDKYKVEIYEGDIITGMFDFGPAGFESRTLQVVWNIYDSSYQWDYWNLTTIEVVGNIFENNLRDYL